MSLSCTPARGAGRPALLVWVACRLHQRWASQAWRVACSHLLLGSLRSFMQCCRGGSLTAGWACTLCAQMPSSVFHKQLVIFLALLLQHDSYLKAIARALHRGNSESQFAAVVVIKYLVAHSASTHYVLAQVSYLSHGSACVHDASKVHGGSKLDLAVCMYALHGVTGVHRRVIWHLCARCMWVHPDVALQCQHWGGCGSTAVHTAVQHAAATLVYVKAASVQALDVEYPSQPHGAAAMPAHHGRGHPGPQRRAPLKTLSSKPCLHCRQAPSQASSQS